MPRPCWRDPMRALPGQGPGPQYRAVRLTKIRAHACRPQPRHRSPATCGTCWTPCPPVRAARRQHARRLPCGVLLQPGRAHCAMAATAAGRRRPFPGRADDELVALLRRRHRELNQPSPRGSGSTLGVRAGRRGRRRAQPQRHRAALGGGLCPRHGMPPALMNFPERAAGTPGRALHAPGPRRSRRRRRPARRDRVPGAAGPTWTRRWRPGQRRADAGRRVASAQGRQHAAPRAPPGWPCAAARRARAASAKPLPAYPA